MNITFSGFYGMRNTGDDCFCKVAEWGAERHWGRTRSYFLAKQLPKLSKKSRKILIRTPAKLDIINSMILNRHFLKNRDIVYAGGSLFHGKYWQEMNYVSKNARELDLRIGAIGVSVGPFSSAENEKTVVDFLKRMAFVSVRDQRSYQLVRSYDIDVPCIHAFDLAGMLPTIQGKNPPPKKTSAHKTIALVLCSFDGKSGVVAHDNDGRLKLIAAAINRIQKARQGGLTLKLLVFNGHAAHGDKHATEKFITFLNPSVKFEIIDYNNDPMVMWSEIGRCDATISCRLHGAIYSFMANVPFVLSEVHEKSRSFLNDISWPTRERIGDFEVSAEDLSALVEKLFHMDNFSDEIFRCGLMAEKNFVDTDRFLSSDPY